MDRMDEQDFQRHQLDRRKAQMRRVIDYEDEETAAEQDPGFGRALARRRMIEQTIQARAQRKAEQQGPAQARALGEAMADALRQALSNDSPWRGPHRLSGGPLPLSADDGSLETTLVTDPDGRVRPYHANVPKDLEPTKKGAAAGGGRPVAQVHQDPEAVQEKLEETEKARQEQQKGQSGGSQQQSGGSQAPKSQGQDDKSKK